MWLIQLHTVLRIIKKYTIISASALINRFIPPIRGIILGIGYSWTKKYTVYDGTPWNVSLFKGHSTMWIADAETIKVSTFSFYFEVCGSRQQFPKAVQYYDVLLAFGPNIISATDSDWKRFRRISATAFSEKNNELVWKCTNNILQKTVIELWKDQSATHVLIQNLTHKISLSVMATAAFSIDIDKISNKSHSINFQDTLHIVANNMWVKIGLPRWVLENHPRYIAINKAFNDMNIYMTDMISKKQYNNTELSNDLFALLLARNQDSEIDAQILLTDAELRDIQEELFREIETVVGSSEFSYHHISEVPLAMAILYETLRLYPPVNVIPKCSMGDTVVTVTSSNGSCHPIPIPKGTDVYIDIVGLHYNSDYWVQPDTFAPKRLLGNWSRDAFLPYGLGSHACLGRRFFEIEALTTMILIIKNYRVVGSEKHRPSSSNITGIHAKNILTLVPNSPAKLIPVVFQPRKLELP
ncbi:cytochrome P450 [Lentinula aff. lateritia]|uniref:Cytochrome P450 n=1 Tax=Lentinula aff. lateritia TaxID=2804960 RepID=A0ACC1U2L3_9AGAR|nr:cytochrome P450 [Lentinula aff. lateritia]